ncbi:MAG: class I SAM-dependent methyltransferase [Betaproteobacteria bacterium]|nr:class I SAM-dependent methyltransferase [Betaproteobacteria bacterium]
MIYTVDLRAQALLREIYSIPKIGVEIGVHKGRLSGRLLAANGHMFLHMVDPWSDSGDTYRQTDDYIATYSHEQHEKAMQQALEAVAPFDGRYKVHRMTSEQAAPLFDDGSLDFVFIDGDHSYEACSNDIRLWWPKLKEGGLLSGHDYVNEKNYGVIRAVNEFVGERELRLGINNTWFITK